MGGIFGGDHAAGGLVRSGEAVRARGKGRQGQENGFENGAGRRPLAIAVAAPPAIGRARAKDNGISERSELINLEAAGRANAGGPDEVARTLGHDAGSMTDSGLLLSVRSAARRQPHKASCGMSDEWNSEPTPRAPSKRGLGRRPPV